MKPPSSAPRPSRLAGFLASSWQGQGLAASLLVGAALLSLAAFWPILKAHYFLDDYAFVAIARNTDHPLSYFINSHFPGGVFYRPSAMLAWWVTIAGEFGTPAQFFSDWVLLGLAALLLGWVLRLNEVSRSIAYAAATLFAVHPIAVTAAAWLSNRFDLLATIGLLLALAGASRWRRLGGGAGLLLTGLGTLLAVTGKELGFITPMVVWAIVAGNPLRRLVTAPVLLSGALATAVFALRAALLPGTQRILYPRGILGAIQDGTAIWLNYFPDFLIFHADAPRPLIFVLAALFLAALVIATWLLWQRARRGDAPAGQAYWPLMGAGLMILAATMLIQSPTLSFSTLGSPTAKAFEGFPFFAARFYYLSFIGLILLAAGLGSAVFLARDRLPNRAVAARPWLTAGLAALALALALHWVWQSRIQGRLWKGFSTGVNRDLAQSAAKAVEGLGDIADRASGTCHYYLLGTIETMPTFWAFSDAIVKSKVTPEAARRLRHCYISTERTPWYYVIHNAGAGQLVKIAPGALERICFAGKPLDFQTFDSVSLHFLAYPQAGAKLKLGPGERVLKYDAALGTFAEVTAAVASGQIEVGLEWSRQPFDRCPS
ncbi:MAG: hypothetical protein F9K47_12050 [Burkholderiales bacterium]|nr:MAG: hypothetical protein F9K47_12050 [Burkholderiales bacterium]